MEGGKKAEAPGNRLNTPRVRRAIKRSTQIGPRVSPPGGPLHVERTPTLAAQKPFWEETNFPWKSGPKPGFAPGSIRTSPTLGPRFIRAAQDHFHDFGLGVRIVLNVFPCASR